MLGLGIFVFLSIMFFYLAWVYHRQAEKRRIHEWVTITDSSLEEFLNKERTPLQVLSIIFSKVFGFLFPKGMAVQNVRDRLVWAGWSKIEVEGYYTIRLILFFIPSLLYPLMLGGNQLGYMLGIGAGVVLFILPEFIVNHRIRQRNEKIEKELLPVTELLVTSTQAGLTLEQAIARITRVREDGIFSVVLRQGFQYMDGIMTREEAYEWMMKQTNVESVHLFIEALAQSGKYGTAISEILKEQLSRIRNDISNKGIARAQAVNGKMMIPTAIFIFLPLLVLVLGPQILALKNL